MSEVNYIVYSGTPVSAKQASKSADSQRTENEAGTKKTITIKFEPNTENVQAGHAYLEQVGADFLKRIESGEFDFSNPEHLATIRKQAKEAFQEGINIMNGSSSLAPSGSAPTSAETPTSPAEKPAAVAAAGAKAEATAAAQVVVVNNQPEPQKPAEEGLKLNNGNIDIIEQTAIELGHSEVQRQLAVQEDLLTTLKNNPKATFGDITAQKAKVLKLKNTISGTQKIMAGDVKNVTDAERESIQSVDFSSLTVGKATASDEQKKAMKELFVKGLTDESYIGKNIFDEKFGKIAEKPADPSATAPAGAPAETTSTIDDYRSYIQNAVLAFYGTRDAAQFKAAIEQLPLNVQTEVRNDLEAQGRDDLLELLN